MTAAIVERDAIAGVVEYLREEADFNRSWTDGRRSRERPPGPEYIARRIEIAEQRERWADLIERQAAEIARLRAGGCARDQTTTQYCAEAVGLAREVERLRAGAWRPIDDEARNGEPRLVRFRKDITEIDGRDRMQRFSGIQAVMRHEGTTPSGYDLGWSFAAPVGFGGISECLLDGWQPLPPSTSGGEG